MCRLLAVRGPDPFDIAEHLRPFARVARHSSEWQGDGWGCAWREDGHWRRYRSVRPLWEDDLERFGRTRLLLAHARRAFRNDPVAVEKNMPYVDGERAFIFNGELHRVRIRASGVTGAEKIFRFILRRPSIDARGFTRSTEWIRRRADYVKAMNLILADGASLYLHSAFSEAEDYFTLHRKVEGGRMVICSQPFPGETGWLPLPNPCVEVFP